MTLASADRQRLRALPKAEIEACFARPEIKRDLPAALAAW
jgi:hypothetical protein